MTQVGQHQNRADATLADGTRAATPRRVSVAFSLTIVAGALVALAGLSGAGVHADLVGGGPSATVPESGTLQVNGTGTTKTIPCHGGYLSVSGQTNTVTVTGHCTSVSVSGRGNRVVVDSADAVSTSGTGNAVTFHWGSPNVANVGTANTVKQG
ncbi:hypothetical protein ABW17_12595 [Mycobacterium nebraskense]|uniref:DUF3060 domain-containing protein n=1 Tax=Mycobacterium nebraskense TaxID=244292 RepID=UPI0006426C53|nr:DUF3060 domain-containing protein [Mycobacterium nebraskense]KLO42099.1 hypothetical protein ABW17_12595 [Mycobacterium nebraskense]